MSRLTKMYLNLLLVSRDLWPILYLMVNKHENISVLEMMSPSWLKVVSVDEHKGKS
jgi:hypothetical protein